MPTLTIVFDGPDVAPLQQDGRRIVLARTYGAQIPRMAWIVLRPRPTIAVRWIESYGLYAAGPTHGEGRIDAVSIIEAAECGKIYPFLGTGFGPATPAEIPQTNFGVRNDATREMSFGLRQLVSVNFLSFHSPLNAIRLPPGCTADFMQLPDAYIWAQAASIKSGTVIPGVPIDATALRFLHRPSLRCRYDRIARAFVTVES